MSRVLTNVPFHSSREEYQECVDIVVAAARENPSVAALYLFGGAWQPGISDLDIIVVYRNEDTPLTSPWELTPKAKRIFTHRYIAMHQDEFPLLHYLYPKESSFLTLLYGEDIPREDPEAVLGSQEYRLELACVLVDVFINKLLLIPLLRTAFETGTSDIRQIIGALYSLRYTSAILTKVTGDRVNEHFEASVSQLRATWFALDEEKALAMLGELLQRSLPEVYAAAESVNRFLLERIASDSKSTFLNRRYNLSFSGAWSPQIFERHFMRKRLKIPGRKVTEQIRMILPLGFAGILGAYGAGEGAFSELMKRAGSVGEPLSIGVSKHTQVLNAAFTRMLASDGLYRLPYGYGFGLFDYRHPRASKMLSVLVKCT